MQLRKKALVFLGTSFVMTLLLACFVIPSLLKEIKKVSGELILTKKDLVVIKEKTEQTSTLKERFSILKPELERIEKLFVDPETPIDFLQFLEGIASNHDVSISVSLLPGKEEEPTPFSLLNFQLSLQGSFPDCLRFLGKLEVAPYLIEIQSFNARRLSEAQLRPGASEGLSPGDVELSLLIKVFTSSPQVSLESSSALLRTSLP